MGPITLGVRVLGLHQDSKWYEAIVEAFDYRLIPLGVSEHRVPPALRLEVAQWWKEV